MYHMIENSKGTNKEYEWKYAPFPPRLANTQLPY